MGAFLGWRIPKEVLPPFSYILSGGTPFSLVLSLFHLFLFPLFHREIHGLGEAPQKYFLHHHHYIEVLLDFPVDPLLPLPHWNEGMEVVVKPYV